MRLKQFKLWSVPVVVGCIVVVSALTSCPLFNSMHDFQNHTDKRETSSNLSFTSSKPPKIFVVQDVKMQLISV